MPSPTIAKLPWPLSYNHIADYLNCQRKTYYKYVAQVREKKTYQQEGGIVSHDALKRYLKFNEPLPPEMEDYERAVLPLKKMADRANLQVELALGCTAEGWPCKFFDDACALRVRLDVAVLEPPVAFITDWKTGKNNERYDMADLELRLQAMLLKIHHPEVDTFVGYYYWLRTNTVGKMYSASLNNVLRTWQDVCRWSAGAANCLATDVWVPDENPLCPWCPVPFANCEYRKEIPEK